MPATTRRTLLTVAAGTAAGLTFDALPGARSAVAATAPANPFRLGVASGDPWSTSVVIWTRLAPEPLLASGGMPAQSVSVQWQVATDRRFASVVRSGTALASPTYAHSVRVEVTGLRPNRYYYYRFRVGQSISRVGRTRTFPTQSTASQSMKFATVSCQRLSDGRFAAYRHLATADVDFVLHLGDYIYEHAGPLHPAIGDDRRHAPFRTLNSLADYRIRHAQYHLDPGLQAAHAAHPFVCVPDDHEVADNMNSADVWLTRRRWGYRAYWEHLPLRRRSMPSGTRMQLYRTMRYGTLADFSVLDTRQYRSPQLPGSTWLTNPEAMYDAARTMTGPAQETWLLDRLAAATTRWNVIAQQVYMATVDLAPGPDQAWSSDKWDGYPAARSRITSFLRDVKPRNPIVLSGDVHAAMVNDVTVDNRPDGKVVATELIGSSISSRKADHLNFGAAVAENPQVRYYNGAQRGYLRNVVTPTTWTAEQWFVDDATSATSALRKGAAHVVQDGVVGAQTA